MKQLDDLSKKFSKLKKQEKILLMVCAAVLAIFPVWSYGFDPAMQKYREAVKSAEEYGAKIEELSQKSDELASGAGISINDQFKQQIAELEKKLAAKNEELKKTLTGLVPPTEMTDMLQNIMSGMDGIAVKELKNLPPENLAVSPDGGGVFRHVLHMEISGGYTDLMRFVGALETLPQKFYWKKISLQGDPKEYPRSTLVLEIYTLSVSEEFISVS